MSKIKGSSFSHSAISKVKRNTHNWDGVKAKSIKRRSGEMGIYSIECTINKSVYVGQSRNISNRFKDHKATLKKKHTNSNLQADFDKYGLEAFKFNILHHCDEHELLEYETYFIRDYQRLGYSVYNIVLDTVNESIVNCPTYYIEPIRRVIKYLSTDKITVYQLNNMLDNLDL